MASCEEMRAKLDRYIDDELPREERLDVESHLGDCPECSEALSARRAAMGLLADWSGSLGDVRPAPRRPARSRLPLVLAAAAALLLVALPVGLHLRDGSTQPDPEPASGKLTWRTLDQGVEIVRGGPGEAVELVVDPFPATLRKLTPTDGVEIVDGKSGGPDELVVDPFPEEGK